MLQGKGGDVVLSNDIGTNPQGTAAVPNFQGILIQGVSNSIIASNLISGNSSIGVQIFNDATIPGTGYDPTGVAASNVVQQNLIGTDAAGTRAIPNGQGVLINDASANLIGGPSAGFGNVISGNVTNGVQILGANATGNAVVANAIGTDSTHARRLPNSIGVFVYAGAGNVVDQSGAATGNTITNNTLANVSVRPLSFGPSLDRFVLIGQDGTISGISLVFSTYLDAARASNAANYSLTAVLPGGAAPLTIPFSVTYVNPSRTVQLIFPSPVPTSLTYQLRIVGTSPGGLTDQVGNFLNGTPAAPRKSTGSDFVTSFL